MSSNKSNKVRKPSKSKKIEKPARRDYWDRLVDRLEPERAPVVVALGPVEREIEAPATTLPEMQIDDVEAATASQEETIET